jgi:hypothetical protein
LQDPSWGGLVHPGDHAFRSFLNELSPEHRQMLLQRAMQLKSAPPAAAPPQAAQPTTPGL